MKTDYQTTGKTYKKLKAWVMGNGSQAMPYAKSFYYFGSSIQFKTCKSFKFYLEAKHSNARFIVNIARG